MDNKFKTLIVEDDEVNIELLKLFLQKYCPNIDVIGEAKNSKEFIDLLLHYKPDILFLDIELGEKKNTFDILNEIGELDCEIIITSSHKDYAIKAINQYQVSGYIIKPIKPTKLINAIKVAEKNILLKKTALNVKIEKNDFSNIIGLPTATSIHLIDIKDIIYLEADGKYTVFHLSKDVVKVVSKNIGFYEKILPKNIFFRIHHKYIVNLKKITTINKSDGIYCILNNGKFLSIANRRLDKLRRFLKLK